jgi:poly(3-hydroxybutyrate) depolymerase
MKTGCRSLLANAAGCLAVILMSAYCGIAAAQAPAQRGPGAAPGRGFAADPRAQVRSYRFADAGQDMPYCVFASSKISRDRAAPLIVSLHGMGAAPTIMCNSTAVELAEEGGYVLVAPMGYSTTGWFGSPVIRMGPGRGPGARPPGTGPATGAVTPPAPVGPSDEQIQKWSEQDVMNVLGMARKEFNVDPRRIYLTGHSMGGAGTLFLGAKHAELWAAIAPVAPASFMMNDTRAQILGKIRDAGVPVLLLTGDADEVVPPANTRLWAQTLKELDMEHAYIEQPGVTHGPVITTSQKEVFAFFARHARK